MGIRKEMKDLVKRRELRAFFKESKIYRETGISRDEYDFFGFVPYGLISKIIGEGDKQFQEFILPFAFTDSINSGEVRLFFNHNPDMELANQSDGGLYLMESKEGIKFRCKMAGGEIRDSINDAVDSGELSGSSVGFFVEEEDWSDDKKIRYVVKGRLAEISVVGDPAYSQSSACGAVLKTN